MDKLIEFLYTANFDHESNEVIHASTLKRKPTSPAKESPAPKKSGRLRQSSRSNPSKAAQALSNSQVDAYSPASTTSPEGDSVTGPLITIIKAYIIADTFDVPALMDLARLKYMSVVVTSWNSPALVESVRLLYDNTPDVEKVRVIKTTAMKTIRTNLKTLLAQRDFQALIEDVGEVALDLLRTEVSHPTALECLTCTSVPLPCKGCRNSGNQRFVQRVEWFCPRCIDNQTSRVTVARCGNCPRTDLAPT